MTAAVPLRRSPVDFGAGPARTETRGDWVVALEYHDERDGCQLIDLSHRDRWDVQDGTVSRLTPWGIGVPERYGKCVFGARNGVLINRTNRTQASVWHLRGTELSPPPDEAAFTNVTDATLFLAILGREVFSIAEKLTALDLQIPGRATPCLLQGPVLHVPSQIVLLARAGDRWGLLFTCSRGYGRTVVEGIIEAGREFDLRPAGERAFTGWLERCALTET